MDRHRHRDAVIRRLGKSVGNSEREFAFAAHTGSSRLRGAFARCLAGAAEKGMHCLGRERIWRL